jgi:hypothetical protein
MRAIELSAVLLITLSFANSSYSAPVSPTAAAIPEKVTPLPGECDVEPLPMAFFEAYVQDNSGAVTPPPFAGLPVGTPGIRSEVSETPTVGPSTEIPYGSAVDSATIHALNDTLNDYIACFNASDPLRQFALFSTRYLNQFLHSGDAPLSKSNLPWIAATPIPRSTRNLISFGPLDFAYLTADGLVCSYPQLVDWPFTDEPINAQMCFVFERGRYRIYSLD